MFDLLRILRIIRYYEYLDELIQQQQPEQRETMIFSKTQQMLVVIGLVVLLCFKFSVNGKQIICFALYTLLSLI